MYQQLSRSLLVEVTCYVHKTFHLFHKFLGLTHEFRWCKNAERIPSTRSIQVRVTGGAGAWSWFFYDMTDM